MGRGDMISERITFAELLLVLLQTCVLAMEDTFASSVCDVQLLWCSAANSANKRGCELGAYRDVCAARTHRQKKMSRATFGYHRTHQNYADGDFRRPAYVPTLPIWTLAVGIGTRTQEAHLSTIGIGMDRQRCEMIARGGAFVWKSHR
jgi:hypothetical protein